MTKLYALKGDYGKIIRARDLYLNYNQTKENKDERKQGAKMITVNQKQSLKLANEERRIEVVESVNNGSDVDNFFDKSAEDILKRRGLV